MLCDRRRVDECSIASRFRTFVVANVKMRVDVSFELAGLCEALGTVAAFVSFLACVWNNV